MPYTNRPSRSPNKWLVLLALLLVATAEPTNAQRGGGGGGLGGSPATPTPIVLKSIEQQMFDLPFDMSNVHQNGELAYVDEEARHIGRVGAKDVAYLKVYGPNIGETNEDTAIVITDRTLIADFLHALTSAHLGTFNNKACVFEVHFRKRNGVEPPLFVRNFAPGLEQDGISMAFLDTLITLGRYQQAQLARRVLPRARQITAITLEPPVGDIVTVRSTDIPRFVHDLVQTDGRLFCYDGSLGFCTLHLSVRGGKPVTASIGVCRNSYTMNEYYPHAPPFPALLMRYYLRAKSNYNKAAGLSADKT